MAWNRAEVKATSIGREARRGRSLFLLGGLVVLSAVGCAVWTFSGGDTGASNSVPKRLTPPSKKPPKPPRDAVSDVMPARMPKSPRKTVTHGTLDLFKNLKGNDRVLAEKVQAALDAGDYAAVRAAAVEALKSANEEVRLNAVDALGWFGAQALPELTGCMADASEEVRTAAENLWENVVQELENPQDRFNVSLAALGSLSDKDTLQSLAGVLSNAAIESINAADDEASEAKQRVKVIQALSDLIGSGSKQNVDAAKEAYENITGNEWRGIDEAERYLRDPDNYEAPAE